MISRNFRIIAAAIIGAVLDLASVCEAMQIGFAYDSYLKPQYKVELTRAAARLGEVIVTTYDKPRDQKFDMVVRVSLTELDGIGGTLAQAAPTHWLPSSPEGLFYPDQGEMQIDVADLNDPGLVNIVTHELIHALGFGTLWEEDQLVKVGRSGRSYFIGKNATRVYSRLTQKKQAGVPLQKGGGEGTAGAHWSETIFYNELMTGYYNTDEINPLSKLTLASLKDMGYEVDYSKADSYHLPSSTPHIQSRLRRDPHQQPYHNCRGHRTTFTCCSPS
ncbi:zinc metalloendopeptidase [Candidatus Odyssella thessalonicensis]|uniref:zinc metalloendopeptidase n=1 Tax=Candidatus Odyssella thessalonicensis TaxID=84647 RepID=UPI000225A9B0|nr:zinc metalloendopeptidase [Candidatus Odyssella thessalonicensis]